LNRDPRAAQPLHDPRPTIQEPQPLAGDPRPAIPAQPFGSPVQLRLTALVAAAPRSAPIGPRPRAGDRVHVLYFRQTIQFSNKWL